MKNFLNKLNGWQRIWFVLTALSVFVFGFIYPVIDLGSSRSFNYRWAIEKDFNNPICDNYTKQPLVTLEEPNFSLEGGSCWHIYTHRKYLKKETLPLTYEAYVSEDNRSYRNNLFGFMGIMSAFVLFCSAIVYGTGKVFVWIRRGFKQIS